MEKTRFAQWFIVALFGAVLGACLAVIVIGATSPATTTTTTLPVAGTIPDDVLLRMQETQDRLADAVEAVRREVAELRLRELIEAETPVREGPGETEDKCQLLCDKNNLDEVLERLRELLCEKSGETFGCEVPTEEPPGEIQRHKS